MKLQNLKAAVGAFALLAGLMTSTSASAGLLLGTATLAAENDLTVVKTDQATYEFLDLNFTLGWSQAEALAEYGSKGFAVATDIEMRELFGSFGIDYLSRKNGSAALKVSRDQAISFSDHLYLGNGMALGSFIDTDFGQSWSCISFNSCNPTSFVSNGDFSSGFPLAGVYMVRQLTEDLSEVPEPGSFALIGLGVAGLLVTRRRQK